MFDAIGTVGSVAVKLIYFRGSDECRASGWQEDAGVLSAFMAGLSTETGYTQIARFLRLVLGEREHVSAVIFIGDYFEGCRESRAAGGRKVFQDETSARAIQYSISKSSRHRTDTFLHRFL